MIPLYAHYLFSDSHLSDARQHCPPLPAHLFSTAKNQCVLQQTFST